MWGGAPAFLEHQAVPDGKMGALGRRYLISRGQFEDVLAQENGRDHLPVLTLPGPGATTLVGSGRYDRLVGLDPVDGIPVVTFTSPTPPEAIESSAPSAAYLGHIVRGIHVVHDLDHAAISAHLLEASGIRPAWDDASIQALFHPDRDD